MTRTAVAVLAMLCGTLRPAVLHAQESVAPVELTLPDAAILERMCSPVGAMQFAFGQTGVPGSTRLDGLLQRSFTAHSAMHPFVKAQPRATEWSGRLMEMTYSFPSPDEDSAYDVMEALAAILEEAGWSYLNMPLDEAPMYLVSVSGFASFEKPVEGDSGPSRVLIGLDYGLGEVTLTCGRDDLLRAHANEAFGKLPHGTLRPLVPEIAVPDIGDMARCTDPAVLAQMESMFATSQLSDEYFAAMLARTNYRDRLTSWMLWKLDESGKISSEELVELSFDSVGAASPGGNPFAALAMLSEMFPLIDAIAAAEKSRDPAALCQSLIPFRAFIGKADAITLKQTDAVQARLTREAARLGVSLE